MLPLRQSCDRCHEHKVRCKRDVPEKTVPCARCTRAGTSCIYSIQQKPGRRLSRKGAAVTRKRSAKHAAPQDLILDESEPEDQMLSGERPPDEWFHGFNTLTASLSPASNTTTPDDASYFCATPLEFSFDPTQTHIEQLAKLVITIGRSVGALSSPARRPTLSASSPPFNDICASASSLIMIMTQLAQSDMREDELDIRMPDLDSHLEPIPAFDYLPSHPPTDNKPAGPSALLNSATLMMILACYQRLLESFETICLFMQQRLHETEMSSFLGSFSPPSLSPPSDTLQFIMMIKLTSDLLSRLDRAMAPLVGNVDKATSYGLSVVEHLHHHISPAPSSSSSSSSSTRRPLSEDLPDRTEREVGGVRSTSNILIMRVGEQQRQQQSRLRTLIKVVKRLVRSQKL